VSERLLLSELTRDEVREVALRATLILPTAATEQHGPHLPLTTDSTIAEGIALRAAAIASCQVPVVVALHPTGQGARGRGRLRHGSHRNRDEFGPGRQDTYNCTSMC